MKRDRSIDYEKGFVVAAMVLCHVLQFFGDPGRYPEQYALMSAVNALAFPLFVFAYGRSAAAAWLDRPWRKAAPRALRSALRAYIAFIISGTAYKVLCENRAFGRWAPLNVVLLRSIPGWSEFLIAFALFGLMIALAMPCLRWLADHPLPLAGVCAGCLAGTLIPYGAVKSPVAGLLIGTTQFACFPVLQYLPFLLAGMYVGRHGLNRWLTLGAAALTGVSTFVWARFGEPGRFPPTLFWLMAPCLGIAGLDALARLLSRAAERADWARGVMKPLALLGMNSLYCLLASNLCIFSVSRMQTLPAYRANEWFPFDLPTGSTPWALAWTAVLLAAIGFMVLIVRGVRPSWFIGGCSDTV